MDNSITQTDTPTQATPLTEVSVKSLSGFDEGTILSTGEVVKGTYDQNNQLVGWHKEAPAEGVL